jgi:uncharacterized protein YecT (DUF1311 family)
MQMPLLIVLLVLFALPARALETTADIIGSCSKDNSHVEMSECIEGRAAQSMAQLKAAESKLLRRIEKMDEEQEYILQMKQDLEKANDTFARYRQMQCKFYASMAAGGNSAGNLRQACITELNERRTDQLQWIFQKW